MQLYPSIKKGEIKSRDYPAIEAMLHKMQIREAVIAACSKEGIAGTFFTNPAYAEPLEGTAT